MSGVRWAVSLRASNSVADDTFVPTDRVRKAATQPAATGQAAETPVSGTKTRLTLEPRKCVYPTRSGFCWSFGFVYMLAMDGPREEYPTQRSFVSQPPTVSTCR